MFAHLDTGCCSVPGKEDVRLGIRLGQVRQMAVVRCVLRDKVRQSELACHIAVPSLHSHIAYATTKVAPPSSRG